MPEPADRPLRILAFGAHADDLELLAGGTLARLAEAGHQLTMATMTWCRYGSYDLEPEACSRARHAEAARSASILGATYRALMVPDDTVNPYDAGQQRLVMELIRSVRPDVILTHSPADYHTDHTNLFELVRWTGPLLGMPTYVTDSPPMDDLPALYQMDTLNGRGFEPTRYVDISDALGRKLELVGCFESQLPFLKRYFGIDVLEQVTAIARFRGLQAGVRHAEGFQRWMAAGWGNLTRDPLP
ncbi:MAG: PIG-L family deacetylase [Chloroflexota bacterium]